LLWDASKATVAAEIIATLGVITGDFPRSAPLAVLPVAFTGSLLFAGMGLAVAARARTIEEISYPQYLLVFPMFLFCGVFFPIESLPVALQWVAWTLPLTSVNSLMRTLTLGFPFQAWSVPILAAWLIALVAFSRRSMVGRLVK
jgi:lipooligosaccharide transport system permease protein